MFGDGFCIGGSKPNLDASWVAVHSRKIAFSRSWLACLSMMVWKTTKMLIVSFIVGDAIFLVLEHFDGRLSSFYCEALEELDGNGARVVQKVDKSSKCWAYRENVWRIFFLGLGGSYLGRPDID